MRTLLPEAGIPSTDKQTQPTGYCGMQLHNPAEIPAPRQQRPQVSISEYQYSQLLTLQIKGSSQKQHPTPPRYIAIGPLPWIFLDNIPYYNETRVFYD